MTERMKTAVKNNIHLIDENNYDEFYKQISSEAAAGYKDIGDVTSFLIETCGITPHLSIIPRGYLFKSQSLRDVKIPEGITGVGMSAYLGSSINKLTLPSTCEWIDAQAFSDCIHLMELRIENPDITVDSSAFTQTHDIGWIMYNGTMEQFKNKTWPDEMIEDSYVICFDGTLHMVNGIARK